MTKFTAAQQTFEIKGVRLGGQPGEVPTVLVGSIFFRGHKLVTNPAEGRFDKKKAQQLLEIQDKMAATTGNPCMLDVVGDTPEAMKHYIDFVAEKTGAPLLLDSTSTSTRIEAVKYAHEIGLLKRVIYNSLIPKYDPSELEIIRTLGLKQAVLLALSPHLTTSTGRIQVIKNSEETGLIDVAQRNGITCSLIDTCVLDIPSLGLACQAIQELKEQFGFVCGCGAHNAVDTWRGLKTKFRSGLRETGIASAAVLATAAGADFVMYGPLEHAEIVFPMVAMVDVAWGQVRFEETKKINREHPRFKIA